MADIKRYNNLETQTIDGDWVRHSDHLAAIKAAVAETARRCAQAAILHNARYMDYRAFDKIKAEFPEAFK